MSLQYLAIVAVAAMAALAALRVIRVHYGRTPHPDGNVRVLFTLGFLLVPPIALGILLAPGSPTGWVRGVASVPVYVIFLGALALLMWIGAGVVRVVGAGQSRPLLLLALVASEGDPNDVAVDPPLTARLAESMVVVDRANAVFPRGTEFPVQIDRSGFRLAWDALNAATATLEGLIATDRRLGLGVASGARATAIDARSRLDTLRRLALDRGQVWAAR